MRIITYNIGLLDVWVFGKKIFEFAPNTRARSLAIFGELASTECDILFIQELYHKNDAQRIKETLSEIMPYSFISNLSHGLRLGHGLAIFSRYPLTDCDNKRFFHQLIDERIFAPKGYIRATILNPILGPIILINTHTTAGGLFEHPESRKTDTCRANQLAEILQEGRNVRYSIIAGDLNCGPDVSVENFRCIQDEGYTLPALPSQQQDIGPTWDPQNPLNANGPHKSSPAQHIDHILFSKELAAILSIVKIELMFQKPRFISGFFHTLSDHYGVGVSVAYNAAISRKLCNKTTQRR